MKKFIMTLDSLSVAVYLCGVLSKTINKIIQLVKMKKSISQIMKDIHARAKKFFNSVFNVMFKKSYRKILAGEITSYWSSVKIEREMGGVGIDEMNHFHKNYTVK